MLQTDSGASRSRHRPSLHDTARPSAHRRPQDERPPGTTEWFGPTTNFGVQQFLKSRYNSRLARFGCHHAAAQARPRVD